MIDKFTGKPIDKLSDRLPHPNGGRCETCGTETIDHCPVCGAPQCCPSCCADAAREGTQQDSDQAARSGLAFTHGYVA